MDVSMSIEVIEELVGALAEAGHAIQQCAVDRDPDERKAWADKADAEIAFVYQYLQARINDDHMTVAQEEALIADNASFRGKQP